MVSIEISLEDEMDSGDNTLKLSAFPANCDEVARPDASKVSCVPDNESGDATVKLSALFERLAVI